MTLLKAIWLSLFGIHKGYRWVQVEGEGTYLCGVMTDKAWKELEKLQGELK